MAVPITTQASTLEGQLFEVATALNNAEREFNNTNTDPNVDEINNVQLTLDTETGTISITATLPVSITPTANGVVVAAGPYV